MWQKREKIDRRENNTLQETHIFFRERTHCEKMEHMKAIYELSLSLPPSLGLSRRTLIEIEKKKKLNRKFLSKVTNFERIL